MEEYICKLNTTAEQAIYLEALDTKYGFDLVIDLGNMRCWSYINELGDPDILWQMLIKTGIDNEFFSIRY